MANTADPRRDLVRSRQTEVAQAAHLVAELEAAAERYHAHHLEALGAVATAQDAERDAQQHRVGDLALAALRSPDSVTIERPTEVAARQLATAEAHLRDVAEIESAVSARLEQARSELAYRRRRLLEAAAPIIEDRLWLYLDEIPQLWQRLRTIRELTLQLSTLFAGNISNRALSVAQNQEPLEANHRGFEVDHEFIAGFCEHATALLTDADASLVTDAAHHAAV